MDKKNVTIYDIAREAAVSPATVSRVISGNAAVSKDKAERVQKAIEKHQFVPNALAKGLKEQRSKIIGVIVPNIKNPYFSSMFYEVQIRAIKAGFMVLLCNTDNDVNVELNMLRTLVNKQVEAVVIIGGALDYKACDKTYIKELQVLAKRMPLVITTPSSSINCIQVINNDKQCMADLTAHLVKKGYQKVALIGGHSGVIPSYDRRRYFTKYAAQNGLVTKEEWMLYGGFSIESGIQLMKKIWENKEKPDAVCGINDLIAVGILKFAYENKITIPMDIGVMGCDGIALGEAVCPALSTVATPYGQFGETIIRTILQALQGEFYQRLITIDMQLIQRQST